jgi:hypothetical protein
MLTVLILLFAELLMFMDGCPLQLQIIATLCQAAKVTIRRPGVNYIINRTESLLHQVHLDGSHYQPGRILCLELIDQVLPVGINGSFGDK